MKIKPVNYARLALEMERHAAAVDDGLEQQLARAVGDIAVARAEGVRGLGERIDAILGALLDETSAHLPTD